jgi:hypothetical protein
VFRRFFDAILEQCQQAKLIWGKELYIDATKVDANASVDSLATRFAVEARKLFKNTWRSFSKKRALNKRQCPIPLSSMRIPNRQLFQSPYPKKSKRRS